MPINAILHGQSYTRPEIDAALAQKQSTLIFDDTPIANSNNPVKSGGIKTELDGKLPIAENQEQAPVGYVLTKTSTGSQWQRASSEGGTIAAAANSYPVTLLASNWSDHTYVIATPTGATITADCDGILGLAPNASAAQVEAFQLAKIVVTSQSTTGVTVVARGQVPTINLSLELTLFMKADYYTKTEEDALLATKAPLGSPALTGTPTAPTATTGTNTTQIATTAFVQTAISGKANTASPALTGTPTAPTPTAGDNSTKIATTAFVQENQSGKADLVPLVNNYVETGTTSAHAYAAGDIVVWNNDLYAAKADIAVGDTLSSTNLLASSIVDKLHRIRPITGLTTYGVTVPTTYKIPVKRQHAGLLIIQRENSTGVCGVYVFHVGNATGELPYLVPIFESGLSGNFSVSTENHYIDVTMPSANVSLHVTMIECEGFQY